MTRTALIAAALSLAALPVLAKAVNTIEGLYSGHGEGDLTVNLTHVKDDIYKISIQTMVPMENDIPGCGGGIDGEVLLSKKGGNFFVENEDYDPKSRGVMFSQRYCEIGLAFDGKGGLKLEERKGCIGYHGASCGFTGELKHDASGI